jgi:hypothetical protein
METKIGEIWKDVIGYEYLYQVSNLGRVKSLVRSKRHGNNTCVLRSGRSFGGEYPMYTLCKNGKYKSFLVHRMVAVHFISNPENKPCVNHIDSDPSNNSVENLEWVTYRENSRHHIKAGRGFCKSDRMMNKEGIEMVFYLRGQGNKQAAIANRLNVNQSVISRILTGADKRYISIMNCNNLKYQ